MIKKSKQTPKTKYLMFVVFIMFISILYATIASAALNANLQITGEALLIPDHTFSKDFEFKNACEEYIVTKTGLYKLEVWGAQGGGGCNFGYGGYSSGYIELTTNTKLYVCVGGSGTSGISPITPGGFNGGGNAEVSDGNNGSGGGATDIRIGSNTLNNRVIVAGGGGGCVAASGSASLTNQRGQGGGLNGLDGINNYSTGFVAGGGTQTAGGTANPSGNSGTFGQGGNGDNANRAGGGGGWYGGASTYIMGGGGSGFTWANGVTTPSGYALTSSYYLKSPQNINGANEMPTTDGNSNMNGKLGNGFAKLTFIGNQSPVGLITYSPKTSWTNQDVNAQIVFNQSGVTITNNNGNNNYIFTENGNFVFSYTNAVGTIGTTKAIVSWIDKISPAAFNAAASDITRTSIKLSGSTSDSASGVNKYYFSKDNGSTWEPSAGQASGTYTFTGLSEGTTYNFKMKAVDNAGNERITNTVSAKTKKLVTLTFYTPVVFEDSRQGNDWTNRGDIKNLYNTNQNSYYTYSQGTNSFTRYAYYEMQGIGVSNSYNSSGNAVTIPTNATIKSGKIYMRAGVQNDHIILGLDAVVGISGTGFSLDSGTMHVGTKSSMWTDRLSTNFTTLPARNGNLAIVVSGNNSNGGITGTRRVMLSYIYAEFVAEWEE